MSLLCGKRCCFHGDYQYIYFAADIFSNAIKTIADYDQVDLLIIHLPFEWGLAHRNNAIEIYVESFLNLNNVVSKPVVFVLHSHPTDEAGQLASTVRARLCEAGFPVYFSFERAVSAINKFIQYHQRQQKGS